MKFRLPEQKAVQLKASCGDFIVNEDKGVVLLVGQSASGYQLIDLNYNWISSPAYSSIEELIEEYMYAENRENYRVVSKKDMTLIEKK